MKKTILTDSDGVLVNWNKGFQSFMIEKGYPDKSTEVTDYSITNRHKITTEMEHDFVLQFNNSAYIENLTPFADSVEYLQKLHSKGFEIIVVSSLSDNPKALEYRTKNLKDIFGDIFSEIHCLPIGANKTKFLKNWKDSNFFWIEDHPNQAEAGLKNGLRPILIKHPYNTYYNTDKFPFVSYTNPWQEIYDIICKDYNLC